MNKLIFASIIAAVFVTGAIFAMHPVDQATTVHIAADRNIGNEASSITTIQIEPDTLVAGDIATDSVDAAELANDAVDTAAVIDDAITAAKLAGSNTAATAPIAIDSGTGTALVAVTGSFNPAVSSQAIVWCTWEGSADGAAITDGIVTLTTSGNGLILGGVAHNWDEAVNTDDPHQATDVWHVTGITNASTFTCTITGTVVDADIDNISVYSLVVPE